MCVFMSMDGSRPAVKWVIIMISKQPDHDYLVYTLTTTFRVTSQFRVRMSTKFCKNPAGVSSHQQQPVTSHCCCSGPGNDCLLLLASARSINCLSSATTRIITHVDTRRSFATFQPFEFYPHSFCPRPLTHLLPLSFCPIPSPFTGVTFSLNGSQKAFIYFNI